MNTFGTLAVATLWQTATLAMLSACATTSKPPSLPAESQIVTVPCDKPIPAPSAAVQAAQTPVDFSTELSILLSDVRKRLEGSTPPSSRP